MGKLKAETVYSWIVFVVSLGIFGYTCEPGASFWDSSEYISTSYKLQVGHPPGAPFFQLTGRIMSLFAFGEVANVVFLINMISVIASTFTVFFLFKTMMILLKTIEKVDITRGRRSPHFLPMIALAGVLTFAFSDSFWTASTETEVYTFSLLFSVIIFWSALKYDNTPVNQRPFRWLLLIVYLTGLSIGIHQLTILVLPAAFLVIGLKWTTSKFGNNSINHNSAGFQLRKTIILSGFLFLPLTLSFLFLPGLITFLINLELFFVNGIGLPFNTGILFGSAAILMTLLLLLGYSNIRKRPILNKLILCSIVFIMGCSSYLIIPVRANADVPVNIGNPDDIFGLQSYYNREIYEKAPLFYGHYFNAPVIDSRQFPIRFIKDEKSKKHIPDNRSIKTEFIFDQRFNTVFPRMWNTEDGAVSRGYLNWAKIKGQPIFDSISGLTINKPTFIENIRFFFNYQLGNMYFRYLLWNFSGKQNDRQHLGGILDGNWISGVPFIDRQLYGPQNGLPGYLKTPGQNKFYLIPLFMGLIGFICFLRKNIEKSLTLLIFFFMFSIAIAIYLNQYFPQPRERDYPFMASFMVFTIWISLGFYAIIRWMSTKLISKIMVYSLYSILLIAIPGNMLYQGWDDHSRHNRKFVDEYAKSILDLCDHHAILFTFGDNDTYPLWYLQEVEQYRKDVRIINVNLLADHAYQLQMHRPGSEQKQLLIPYNFHYYNFRDLKKLVDANRERCPIYFSHFFDQSILKSNGYRTSNSGLIFKVEENPENHPSSNLNIHQIYQTFILNNRLNYMIGSQVYLDQNMRETALYLRDILVNTASEFLRGKNTDACDQILRNIMECFPVEKFGPSLTYLKLSDLLEKQGFHDEANKMRNENLEASQNNLKYFESFKGWQVRFIKDEKEEALELFKENELNIN